MQSRLCSNVDLIATWKPKLNSGLFVLRPLSFTLELEGTDGVNVEFTCELKP